MKNLFVLLMLFCFKNLSAQFIYLTHGYGSGVEKWNAETLTFVADLNPPGGMSGPNETAISSDGHYLYASDGLDIYKFDAWTNTYLLDFEGSGLALSPNNRKLLFYFGTNVWIYHTGSGWHENTMTDFTLRNGVFSPDGNLFYSTDGNVIDMTTFAVVGNLSIPGIRSIVISPDGSKLYVLDGPNVHVLNAITYGLMTSIPISTSGINGGDLAITESGGTVFVSGLNILGVIKTGVNVLRRVIPYNGTASFGWDGESIDFDPVSQKIFINCTDYCGDDFDPFGYLLNARDLTLIAPQLEIGNGTLMPNSFGTVFGRAPGPPSLTESSENRDLSQIRDWEVDNLIIYENPMVDHLKGYLYEPAELVLFSNQGQKMYTWNFKEPGSIDLDISQLTTGVYFLSDQKGETKKIIKL